jgi:hypothetical protein
LKQSHIRVARAVVEIDKCRSVHPEETRDVSSRLVDRAFGSPTQEMRPGVRVAVLLSEERQRPIKDAKVHRRLRLHVEVDWSA